MCVSKTWSRLGDKYKTMFEDVVFWIIFGILLVGCWCWLQAEGGFGCCLCNPWLCCPFWQSRTVVMMHTQPRMVPIQQIPMQQMSVQMPTPLMSMPQMSMQMRMHQMRMQQMHMQQMPTQQMPMQQMPMQQMSMQQTVEQSNHPASVVRGTAEDPRPCPLNTNNLAYGTICTQCSNSTNDDHVFCMRCGTRRGAT